MVWCSALSGLSSDDKSSATGWACWHKCNEISKKDVELKKNGEYPITTKSNISFWFCPPFLTYQTAVLADKPQK
jgi:hypothetical protein